MLADDYPSANDMAAITIGNSDQMPWRFARGDGAVVTIPTHRGGGKGAVIHKATTAAGGGG